MVGVVARELEHLLMLAIRDWGEELGQTSS
jgi:hypothetical protein